mmetsp:Transcript_12343/g.37068  ORF Transcript_12343/g.37068 Transcript_12343/m.37068 type:complete len:248 (+) Transcript_12343:24-767(+)
MDARKRLLIACMRRCMSTQTSITPPRTWSVSSTCLRKCCATLYSASSGHSVNQSMVQQFTRLGNMRRRLRKASPMGDIVSTMCRFVRQRPTKKDHSSAWLPRFWMPASLAGLCRASMSSCSSSCAYRFGTSPVLRMPLMSSTKASMTICVSSKRNTVGSLSRPAHPSTFLRSSCHSTMPYVLLISIWKSLKSAMATASVVSDLRPEPPTPTSSAFPYGRLITRLMRATCSMAFSKSTRLMGLDVIML